MNNRKQYKLLPNLLCVLGACWTVSVEATAVYCGDEIFSDTTLEGNLDCTSATSHGLIIGNNDVTIDLNGFTIMGSDTGAAIFGDGFSHLTVKNGAISGFMEGIWLFNFKDVAIEQIAFTHQGDDSIQINHSKNVLINDVQTSLPLPNHGSSIVFQFVHGANLTNLTADGGFLGLLSHESRNVHVADSSFSNVRNMGVRIVKNKGSVIENIRVFGASTCDSAIGVVWLGPSERIQVLNNVVSGCRVGVLAQTELPSQINIRDNRILANADGILLYELMNSDVTGNRVHFNNAGIVLLEDSYNNKIRGNIVTGNRTWDIFYDDSSYPNDWKNNTCVLANHDDIDCQ